MFSRWEALFFCQQDPSEERNEILRFSQVPGGDAPIAAAGFEVDESLEKCPANIGCFDEDALFSDLEALGDSNSQTRWGGTREGQMAIP